jgi:flagellin
MSISIQTNVNSLIAQQNLRVNSDFQSKTIEQLTSGYRINSSGDDAAGLAVANKYRSDVAELQQGVLNANDGVSQLQIIDGGMNNISQMLDRLKTLATQSASDTFSGDRNVVNSEFQTLLGEIDRQAKSIGLDANGEFAKNLGVYIGGGRDNTGAVNTSNGTVNINLTNSVVDTRALGLQGMQVTAGTADIGDGSSTHTVQQIVTNASNVNSLATQGNTVFNFSGPGFSDGSKIAVSVNLQNVDDIGTLVTAINSAIQNAGNNTSQAATAFKNAGIVASVYTDGNGGQELAFSSSTAAFQVEAGDQMANALMGNFGTGAAGASLATTVTGGATTAGALSANENIAVKITGGGMVNAVSFSLPANEATGAQAISDLISHVASDPTLKAAGISVSGGTAGSPLVFTSATGQQLGVEISGDTQNALGFGSFLASGANADYTAITGNAAPVTSLGTAHLEFSINGGASNTNGVNVDLSGGDATAAVAVGAAATATPAGAENLTISIDGVSVGTVALSAADSSAAHMAGTINASAAGTSAHGVIATVNSSGELVITAKDKGAHALTFSGTGSAVADAGLTTFTGGTGTARSAQSVADALNTAFATNTALQNAGLKASVAGGQITIASANGTAFRVNPGTSGATADIGFGTAGAAFSGATASNAVLTADDANGAANVGTGANAFSFTGIAFGGDNQAVTISANSLSGASQAKTITLTSANAQNIDQAISYINTQLQQTNNPTLQSIVAVKENDATNHLQKINFISSLDSFSVSVGSANGEGFNGGTAETANSTMLGTGSTVNVASEASALAAVTAIANAVTKLGSAQAAVGRGQNQLNYAQGLAQSQISSFSAAESRIRDADVAAEAANLTKAQVLQQASIAAMAQANSAPQAVLKLLG